MTFIVIIIYMFVYLCEYVCLCACTCLLRPEVGRVQAFVNCLTVGAGIWTPILRTEQRVVLTAEVALSPGAGFQGVNACVLIQVKILTHCQEGGIMTL